MSTPPRFRHAFACLVHERRDCVVDLVRNLRHYDPASDVVLFNGGDDPSLLAGHELATLEVAIHPRPRRLVWGRLHDFAFDALRFCLDRFGSDAVTMVDSDQLLVRHGYSERIGRFFHEHPDVGLVGTSDAPEPPTTDVGPACAAWLEAERWQSVLARLPGGSGVFPWWTFWPGTIVGKAAATALLDRIDHDAELRALVAGTGMWATEEILLPTLVAACGFSVHRHPTSQDLVRYGQPLELPDLTRAWSCPDTFLVHPVRRRYCDPVRSIVRTSTQSRVESGAASASQGAAPLTGTPRRPPLVSCIIPTRGRPELLRNAVACALAQDHPAVEVIVVEDGGHALEGNPFGAEVQHIRLSRSASIGAKRNIACAAARGELIAHFDDDDWSAPWRLRYQVEQLLRHDADLTAPATLLYEKLPERQAFRLRLGGLGGPLLFRRSLWHEHPFRDIDFGEDTAFVQSCRPARRHALERHDFFIGRLHASNTAPHDTREPRWTPIGWDELARARTSGYSANVEGRASEACFQDH